MSTVQPAEDNVTLGDSRVDIQTFDRYKGRKGATDRFAILSTTLIRTRTHYHEKGKTSKTFKCLSTPGKLAACCTHKGDPDQKFGLVLFQYLTDEKGALLTDEKLTGKVKLWVVSETRYLELSAIHKEFPLLAGAFGDAQVDLMATCTEEKFQRMTFTPCNKAFWKTKEAWYDAMMSKEAKARAKLAKVMGLEMSENEILEFLEVDAPNPFTGGAGDTAGGVELDLGDILS